MGRPTAVPAMRDIILTCLLLDHTSFGRYKLSTYLGLTKAKTRAVLEYLTEQGIAESSRGRGGTRLTSKGKNMMREVKEYCQLDWQQELTTVEDDLIPEDHEIAVLLMEVDELPTSGLYERDTAVRMGAVGAITIVKPDIQWVFPGDEQIMVEEIEVNSQDIEDEFNMITIAFSKDIGPAYAGIAAILIYHLETTLVDIFHQYGEL